jgi:gliding motility-associated-like protein
MVQSGSLSIITMNKALAVIAFLALAISVDAQFVLGRQTMSCFSIRACDELCINSTAGQIDFGTLSNDSTIFTSGFEQTEGASNLYPKINFSLDECSGLIRADITKTFGCENADSVFVFWDNVPAPFMTNLAGSLHTLRMETNTGCVFEKVYDFQILNVPSVACGLEFYNYLSPNGDGSNDSWIIGNIEAAEFSENEVVIMNRCGSEVWRGANYDNSIICWKGTGSNGLDLPDGTYFYRVKTSTREYTGYIELLR